MKLLFARIASVLVAVSILVGAGAVSAQAAPQDDVLSLTNAKRASAGLAELTRDATLDAAAQQWASEMSRTGVFTHSSNEWRAARIPAGWTTHGENIAYGYGSASAVMTEWMRSDGHRANILRSTFTHIGIGYVASGDFWVQIFAGYAVDVNRGRPEITSLYSSLGGAAGALGEATSDFISISANGGGVVRAFANGAIAWSPAGGAHAITGTIRTQYNAAGGVAALGWPTSSANSISANGGGVVQGFQKAAVVSPNSTNAVVLKGDVRTYFNSIGGLAGPMGWPTSIESCTTGACNQAFQGGTIYVSSQRGPTHVPAVFASAYAANPALGAPVSAPVQVPVAGGGIVQGFENGALVKQASGAVQAISGATRALFNAAGGLAGTPGWPTGALTCLTDTKCSQTFQNGAVHSSAGAGSFVPGRINAAYLSLGGVTGSLGTPVSAAVGVAVSGGGTVQAFSGGAITDSSRGGTHSISGPMRSYFNAQGGLGGRFGWPTSSQSCDSTGTCTQSFLGGTLVWSPTTGGSVR